MLDPTGGGPAICPVPGSHLLLDCSGSQRLLDQVTVSTDDADHRAIKVAGS